VTCILGSQPEQRPEREREDGAVTTLRVRYRSGQQDEFVRDQHQPKDVAALLHRGLANDAMVVLGLASRAGHTADAYAVVGLRMNDVVMWELDPISDNGKLLAAFMLEQTPGVAGPPPA
jgi:hypothetical protein